jgi:hypothetical protein
MSISLEAALDRIARDIRPVLIVYADWSDAAGGVYVYDPEYPDADDLTGRQVADFRHDTAAAARHFARDCDIPGLYAVLHLTPDGAVTATSTVELYELDLDGRRVHARGTYRVADLGDNADPDPEEEDE